jgi:hypothetical protein
MLKNRNPVRDLPVTCHTGTRNGCNSGCARGSFSDALALSLGELHRV